MQSERPNLSITLPRNFMFHYKDGQPPRTPEPEQQPEALQPPAPRQVLKVRRRRTAFTTESALISEPTFDGMGSDLPIPTIEAPEFHSFESSPLATAPPALNSDYLSPAIMFNRMISPPRTPVSQMRNVADMPAPQHWDDMDAASQSESSSRPTSSSGFSDSSMSSFESFPSFGGGCTSPEEDMSDPFSTCSPTARYAVSQSPFITTPNQQPAMKLRLKPIFTEEMDNHIWMTYTKYLQDPTVTPFKALPSTVPPNGVCHRVARMARKTWKGSRPASRFAMQRVSQHNSRSGTPDTIKPAKSGSSTPVPGASKHYARFPTEKQVRKRLRDLAKQKPTLSAHYQRLLHRSPSPFQSSPQESSQPHGLSSPFTQEGPSFSTRDMNVSLATSTAASMQFGNPLSQLAADVTPRIPLDDRSAARASAHQKSQSLHIGLGIGLGGIMSSSVAAMNRLTGESIHQYSAQTWHAPAGKNPPRLGSPLQLHAPRPISRVFKRRALHNFEDQARNRGSSFVNELFGAPAESSHRRVRSRGFSLGDMVEGARRLAASPPAASPEIANLSGLLQGATEQASSDSSTQSQGTVRLGSPFAGRSSNTFPRASTSHGFEPPASFEQRFAGLPSDPDHLQL